MKGAEYYIANIKPQDYKIKDIRANKPLCFMDKENTDLSMVIEEIDKVNIIDEIKVNRSIKYCAPNNISILLSTSKEYVKKAEKMYNNTFCNLNFHENSEDKIKKLYINSKKVYDYLEIIQIAIVFSYTTLEAFANTSIPEDYNYEIKNNKGIIEKYDKNGIERWLSLKDKVSNVLVELFETGDIKKEKFWSQFCELEKIRNSIIHQKSINGRDFYKQYFDVKIFELCKVSEEIIKFFIDNNKSSLVCPMWPWIIGAKNLIPISQNVNDNIELIGNIFDD